MTPEAKLQIVQGWARLPDELKSPPATAAELVAFEEEHGAIPEDFRWFLATCGGGPVGSEWVDDIAKLAARHARFDEESQLADRGWTMRGVFVIGWDGFGNPYGIQLPDGPIMYEDHEFGGIYEKAPSFESFLRDGLLT